MKEIKNIVESEEKERMLKHPPILKDVGGSIGNLPVKTEEYRKWLDHWRSKNRLIGSEFIEPAPEYGTKFQLGETEVNSVTEEQLDKFKSNELYNFESESNSDSKDLEDLEESPIKDTTDNKYIDFCIIELSTKKLLGKSVEDIEKDALDEIKKYHKNENYVIEIDVKQIIEISKQLLIENKNNNKNQLNKPE